MKCTKGLELEVHSCGAGYYIGTWDDEGPNCRCSGYYTKKETALRELDNCTFNIRICTENSFCNGGIGCIRDLNTTTDGEWHMDELKDILYGVCKKSVAKVDFIMTDQTLIIPDYLAIKLAAKFNLVKEYDTIMKDNIDFDNYCKWLEKQADEYLLEHKSPLYAKEE